MHAAATGAGAALGVSEPEFDCFCAARACSVSGGVCQAGSPGAAVDSMTSKKYLHAGRVGWGRVGWGGVGGTGHAGRSGTAHDDVETHGLGWGGLATQDRQNCASPARVTRQRCFQLWFASMHVWCAAAVRSWPPTLHGRPTPGRWQASLFAGMHACKATVVPSPPLTLRRRPTSGRWRWAAS